MSDRKTTETLFLAAYHELRRLARGKLHSERPDHTLQATALVHEVYCRLRGRSVDAAWNGRDHFLAVAAEAMRSILVDHARRKLAAKRGGGHSRLSLDGLAAKLPMQPAELLEVDDVLDRLAEEHPLAADLVKLRIFGGLPHVVAAEKLGLSKRQADRLWVYAKARLYLLMTTDTAAAETTRADGVA